MGRRRSPFAGGSGLAWRWRALLCSCVCLALAWGCVRTADPASAQAPPAGQAAQPVQKDRLLVDAKQLVYDRDTNVVTAAGNVQLYYQGRVLEADKVIYDRTKNRVYAEGNAKLTEADGTITYSDRFDLTDDFKSGFIDSLSAVTKDKTFFTAPRAERSEGETTEFDKGTYTACAPCKEHPERPPLWQIRAMKIIHKAEEQTIYFEDAVLELYGLPIAYLPYFSTADPTVTRKTGFLTPYVVNATKLGSGLSTPFFWNLAPNYDVTLTPTVMSRQGFLGAVEWRHRLGSGSYTILGTGIYQLDPTAFLAKPFGPGDQTVRGSLETTGKFLINRNWSYGWDIALLSDKYFTQDYRVRSSALGTDFVRESISTAYLTGQGNRSYFDLRGYRIQGLSAYDYNGQQPLVLPVLEYNRTLAVAPEISGGVGGEIKIDSNVTSLSRSIAAFQATGNRVLDQAFGLYDVCPTSATPNPALPNFKPPSCFLRGVGGDYTRASTQVSYQRKFIDPIGEVWTPFAFARVDGSWLDVNTTDSHTFSNGITSQTIDNADQSNFFGSSNTQLNGRAVPGVGLEWRYPLIASTGWASHVVEPIAQIIVRPDVAKLGKLPNEDAQSLVFDDTTLFEWNKFSGYDRIEGGVRANAGAQYTMNFKSGGYANALFGESFHLAGQNPYAISDISNVGLNSGLDTDRSDYVARALIAPTPALSLLAKARFDSKDFSSKAIDVIGTASFFGLSSSVQYGRYAPQPLIGFPEVREGVLLSERYDVFDHYYVSGSATIDLQPFLLNPATGHYDLKLGHPALSALGAGIGYQDDCTTLTFNYSRGLSDSVNTQSTSQTFIVSLTLRSLADVKFQQSLGTTTTVEDAVFK